MAMSSFAQTHAVLANGENGFWKRPNRFNGPRGIDNVIEQCEIIKRSYELLGAGDKFATDMFDGGHEWHGQDVYGWLDRWLRA